MTFRLSGRRALVVGGSSGIGSGIARRLQAAGATVHITGTRARDEYGQDMAGMTYHRLDVRDDAAVTELAGELERLNVLVYSAGTVA